MKGVIGDIGQFRQRQAGAIRKFERSKAKRLLVCVTGCRASGALEVFAKFKEAIKSAGLGKKVELVPTGCQKFCSGAPMVTVEPEGFMYRNVSPEDVDELLDKSILRGESVAPLLITGKKKNFFGLQKIKTLAVCGVINPLSPEEYLWKGGFEGFVRALERMSPEGVIGEIKKSKLRGRGGAGFPTGTKWEAVKNASGFPKFVICNGDEGDPGAFMDRTLLEGAPFQVIEGILTAAYAVGAVKGYVYVRAEYPVAVEHLEKAAGACYDLGLLGSDILGTGFSFDLEIREGAGAFVCGEETALIASIEGRRGMPSPRPPFPAEKGLMGLPACINNVETLANVPLIISGGGDEFAETGTKRSGGTKLFSLAGKVRNTGLVEVELGTSISEIVYGMGGGPFPGRKIKGVQTGGPAGGCIPVELFNTAVDYETLNSLGSIMGSGGMIVVDDRVCMVNFAKYFLEFAQKESCGKCVPCRIGTKRLLETLREITAGRGRAGDIAKLENLGKMIALTSLCGLGRAAPNPVLTTLKYFRDEYEEHIQDGRCRAGVCKALVGYGILKGKCTGCHLCFRACPSGAVAGKPGEKHRIIKKKCIRCGACFNVCKFSAVRKA